MEDLIALLERSCVGLDRIRYRTTLALLLLRAGESRFLPRVADELHDAVDELAQLELRRATLIAELADELGTPEGELSLAALIAGADAATAVRMRNLQERLRRGLTELQELAGSSTVVAASELDSVRRSLGRWSGVPAAATAYGLTPPAPPARFERSL